MYRIYKSEDPYTFNNYRRVGAIFEQKYQAVLKIHKSLCAD